MAATITSINRPVGAKLDKIPDLNVTTLKPAPKLQPASMGPKVITGTAVSQPTQPAAAQQPSPGQAAQAAPKPAPTWRAGNSVSNGYQQDRTRELYQGGMNATQAARQGAADSQRMAAAWKNAPKVDEKSLSTWGKDSTGKFRMLKAGSATPGGVTAPTTAPKATPAKVAAPAARPAARQESPLAKSWRQPITKQPTPMRTQSLTQAAGFATKSPVKAAASSPLAASWKSPVVPQPSPMRTQSLTQAAGFKAKAATKPPVKAAAASVKPAVQPTAPARPVDVAAQNARAQSERRKQADAESGKRISEAVGATWRTLGNIISPTDPNRFDIPESDRKGFRRVGK